jgi:hypothetical protein
MNIKHGVDCSKQRFRVMFWLWSILLMMASNWSPPHHAICRDFIIHSRHRPFVPGQRTRVQNNYFYLVVLKSSLLANSLTKKQVTLLLQRWCTFLPSVRRSPVTLNRDDMKKRQTFSQLWIIWVFEYRIHLHFKCKYWYRAPYRWCAKPGDMTLLLVGLGKSIFSVDYSCYQATTRIMKSRSDWLINLYQYSWLIWVPLC